MKTNPFPVESRLNDDKINNVIRMQKNVRTRKAAFSLVEVTIALGIIGYALVLLMGMLPVGLNTFRASMDATIGSQIVQKVAGDMQQADFTTISSYDNTNMYYNGDGTYVGINGTNRVYDVLVTLSKSGGVYGTLLPGTTTASTNLVTATIKVANNPGKRTDVFSAGTGKGKNALPAYTSYTVCIGRTK
jgi:uncharacterized protein (TIGR02598 family)